MYVCCTLFLKQLLTADEDTSCPADLSPSWHEWCHGQSFCEKGHDLTRHRGINNTEEEEEEEVPHTCARMFSIFLRSSIWSGLYLSRGIRFAPWSETMHNSTDSYTRSHFDFDTQILSSAFLLHNVVWHSNEYWSEFTSIYILINNLLFLFSHEEEEFSEGIAYVTVLTLNPTAGATMMEV